MESQTENNRIIEEYVQKLAAAEERIKDRRREAWEAYMRYRELQGKAHEAEMALVELRRNGPEKT